LQTFLEGRSTQIGGEKAAELFVFRGKDGEYCFVCKDNVPLVLSSLLDEAKPQIKTLITVRWTKLLEDCSQESAMEDNDEFELLLARYTKKFAPSFIALLKHSQLPLLYLEKEKNKKLDTKKGSADLARFFVNGRLAPFETLLQINRKVLIHEVRLMLPMWYTIPVLANIILFFKKLKKKGQSPVKGDDCDEGAATANAPSLHPLEKKMVPEGHTSDSYLEELHNQWNKQINEAERRQLSEDVKSVIRQRVRNAQGSLKLTEESLDQFAKDTMFQSSAFSHINNRESLLRYIKLYAFKLLKNKSSRI
jgi:hypothetical protein